MIYLTLLITVSIGDKLPTIISFAFDDTLVDGKGMVIPIEKHGWLATFYLSFKRICTHRDYLTHSDVDKLVSHGHEIGGHSLSHVRLNEYSKDEMLGQVCGNQALLEGSGWGPVTSHAFPFAITNDNITDVVKQCYKNARTTSSRLRSQFGCNDCDVSEFLPPKNVYNIRSFSIRNELTSEKQRELIQLAISDETTNQNWVILNLHRLCENDDDACWYRYPYSIHKISYYRLVDYVKALVDNGDVIVLPINQAMDLYGGTIDQNVPNRLSTFSGLSIPINNEPINYTIDNSSSILHISFGLFLWLSVFTLL